MSNNFPISNEEYKLKAKDIQSNLKLPTLLAAQNILAKQYGYKDYKDVRNKLIDPDNVKIEAFIFLTYYLDENTRKEIQKILDLFSFVLSRLEIYQVTKFNDNSFKNKFDYHYKANKLCEVYLDNYENFINFLTNEEFLFVGKIKSNLSKMFLEDKYIILETLRTIDTHNCDSITISVKNSLLNLIEYSIKNDSLLQRTNLDFSNVDTLSELSNFVLFINRFCEINKFTFESIANLMMDYFSDKMKLLKSLLLDSDIIEIKKGFAYKTKFGMFIIFKQSDFKSTIKQDKTIFQQKVTDLINTLKQDNPNNYIEIYEMIMYKLSYEKLIPDSLFVISCNEILEYTKIQNLNNMLKGQVD